ncbi:YjbQ family protein [Candidatus Woesearchaeota archaeon]|nr:secondary thiamine-phosphate synthase enzyme YjbQ [Candidatus Woesearchaeota archaeon]RLE43631.1 MAG: YjbQ family protein [Candidatus Woesearchaeota archaeon]
MEVITKRIRISVERDTEFVDITEYVREVVKASGVSTGFALVFTKHTTAAIRINENEPLLLKDIHEFLQRLAPKGKRYNHDQLDMRDCPPNERINAHSHLRSLLMGASECIPIINGELELGRWQSIFFVDLDGYGREREVLVQVVGE